MSATCRACGTAALTADARFCHACGSPITSSVPAQGDQRSGRSSDAPLVGRAWELNTLRGILDEAVNGAGCIVSLTGPAGIGKSRLARETAAIAAARDIPVFSSYCESHTCDIPFRTLAQLLRAALEIDQCATEVARGRRAQTDSPTPSPGIC